MLDGSATLPLGAAAGTRKCRVPVSCLLAGLVLESEGRCEGGQPSALPSLALPTGGWRGGAGRDGRGKASTASAKHHKGAHFLAAAEPVSGMYCTPILRWLGVSGSAARPPSLRGEEIHGRDCMT